MTPPNLSAAIDQFNANDLATLLRAAGVVEIPKSKNDRAHLWLRTLGDPVRIRRALAQQTPASRRALEVLQSMGTEVRTGHFRSLLVRAGVVAASELPPTTHEPTTTRAAAPTPGLPTFASILEDLLRSGLIWTHSPPPGSPVTAKIDFRGGLYVYIPAEVAKHLPPAPIRQRVLPQVTYTLEGSARTCQRDLYLLWSASREAALQITNAGLVRVSDLKRMAGQLLVAETFVPGSKESDYRRLFWLRSLANALGILRGQPHHRALEAHPSPNFLAQAPPDRVRLSFAKWREGDWWNELWTTLGPTFVSTTNDLVDPAPPRIVDARRAVIETLVLISKRAEQEHAASTAWVSLEEISTYLRERNDEFLVDRATSERFASTMRYGYITGQTAWGTYSPYEYNSLGWTWPAYVKDEEAGWNGVERVFVQAVLTEGLYWLGLVDLGYTQPVTPTGGVVPPGVVAVRMTAMGRWLLLGALVPEIPEESGRVVVQPNFRIFAFDPISDAVLARLDSFANRQNAERAIEYELSRESVYRAQLAGQGAGQIAAWLEQVTGAPLPQNVARSLAEWQAAYERVTVHRKVGWLEATTPDLVDAVLHNPRLSSGVIKRVTPTGLIVRVERIQDLERALLQAGELPVRDNDPHAARRHSIVVDENGQVSFVRTTPSLHVAGYLYPFCEQTPPGWQITARSVRRANSTGLDAATILGRLDEMAVGGVPPALVVKIKVWSQHFGTATLQTLTLVQFRDQAALDELRSDPQLARYLKPFKPEAKLGLAIVAPENVAAVSALLGERGVELGSRE